MNFSIIFVVLQLYKKGIPQHVFFSVWLLLFNIVCVRVIYIGMSYSSSILIAIYIYSISFYEYIWYSYSFNAGRHLTYSQFRAIRNKDVMLLILWSIYFGAQMHTFPLPINSGPIAGQSWLPGMQHVHSQRALRLLTRLCTWFKAITVLKFLKSLPSNLGFVTEVC